MARPDSYSAAQKSVHWVLFGLVVGLYLLTYAEGLFQRGSIGRAWVWWLHISFGLLLAAFVIARIGLRVTRSAPAPSPELHRSARFLSSATHVLLYLLLIALPIAGIILTWSRGDHLSFFGVFTIPAPFAPNRAFARGLQEVHGLMADAIIVIAAGHAAAALYHHFVLGDDVLRRMLPGSRTSRRGSPDAVDSGEALRSPS
jgi:cytochrome b561